MSQMDVIDLIFAGLSAPNTDAAYVRPPNISNRNDGKYSIVVPEDLSRAAIRFQDSYRKLNFGQARNMLALMEHTIQVEKIASLIREIVYARLLVAVGAPAGTPIPTLVWQLYAAYGQIGAEEVVALVEKTGDILTETWGMLVKDEEGLTEDELRFYYNNIPFPVGCTFRKVNGDSLSLAYQALPFWASTSLKPKAAFDFGGNSGLMTTLMAVNGAERCLLVDFSAKMLDFARWKDRRMGVANVDYLEFDAAVTSMPTQYKERFDYGICTEVMEHVFDVEKAVAAMATLLKKDGLLFYSSSFGHYPYATHLRKNVVYAGKEDELLRRHGLQPVEATFPIPLLPNQKIYKKVNSLTSTHRK